ncbi:hypothetical protein CALVIDRAFT_539749 [Calocera viscosa TUFC12733]|uniref:CCHC-type domain-containing protein n=1 Tax=Calocera viscosa (strain TUFC12733) TaxID=1330018 RepID=A0A167JGJ2_CALVF|nr:hypothetical protein CALVIDRAFT_539749 [Calocera viscosa TUFC12733]
MSMQAHIVQVLRLASRLNSIGVKIMDEDKILVLLNGLPDDYANLVMTLEGMAEATTIATTTTTTDTTTTSNATLSFDYVTNCLLNEEARCSELPSSGPVDETALRMCIPANLGTCTCWRCGQRGHIACDCTHQFPTAEARCIEVF